MKKFKVNKKEIIITLLILVVAVIPRVFDLGQFLTADEKNWIGRSYEFIRAFKDWRFNDMLQTTHPGVTTLWLSGLTITMKILTAQVPFSFSSLVLFVKAAQLPIALVNAGLVMVIYILLRILWPARRGIAVLAALMIGLDPIIVGYSRVVHVDALLGGFMMAAGIAILLWASRDFNRKWLVTAAVLTALAGLTKVTAVFLLPYIILAAFVYGGRRWLSKDFLVERARDLTIWALLIGIIILIVWPALLWVPNPEGNVLVLKRDISIAATTPHHMANTYELNSSFYWLTLLSRSTPLTLIMVLILLMYFILTLGKKNNDGENVLLRVDGVMENRLKARGLGVSIWLLAAYVFFFVVMMTLGAKKGDRYILPVFFALNILSAWGGWCLAMGLKRILAVRNAVTTSMVYKVIGLVVVAHMSYVLYQYHPYAVAYSNPWLPDNLSQELGWGEGLEQVGAWLNENDPEAVVASWYPEELGAYTTAAVAHINAHEQSKVKYVVLYRNMFGREADHYANDFIDEYYKKKAPVFIVSVVGKEFAWVYEKKVYDRVLAPLSVGKVVSQSFEAKHSDLAGVDIMAATYSGQAIDGLLEVELINDGTKQVVGQWQRAVNELDDRGWTNFILDSPINSAGWYTITVKAKNTGQKAPTIRYAAGNDYRSRGMVVDGDEKKGNLAIRVRYNVDGEILTEDDQKRLR